MKKLFYVLLVLSFILVGCGWRAEIEQEVKSESLITCTYSVGTYVWQKNLPWWYQSEIIRAFHENNIVESEIENTKKRQYQQALPYYIKLQEAIKNNCK